MSAHTPLPQGFRLPTQTNGTEEFFVNMGPQHPSTHGVLRLVVRLDGETVIEVVPHFGYIHRGLEKQAENESYIQYIHLTDRQDYLTAHQNNLGVCMAIEKGMGIGVPERGEYIRVMVSELNRIASHLVFYACFGGDMGGQTTLLYGFKEREMIHDLFDKLCGQRLTMNYFRPGGSVQDVYPAFVADIKDLIVKIRAAMVDYEKFLSKNIVVLERSIGIGKISREQAIAYGCSGPVLRACGVNYDVRRNDAYGIYDRLDFQVPVAYNGDNYDRYTLRIAEIHESLKILEQCCAQFPEGPYRAKEKPSYRLPQGMYYSQVETAKGIYGTTIVAEKGDKPYRIHTRSPSFANMAVFNEMVKGHKVADIVTILATIDPVIPDIDR